MILNKYKFRNTLDQDIEMLPIATFLFDYPDYGRHLAEVIEFWAKEASQISATRIQRKCMIRYQVADAMLESLLCSRVAVRLPAPVRVEVCLDETEARRISECILDSIKDYLPDENKRSNADPRLMQEALHSAFDLYFLSTEEKSDPDPNNFLINDGHLSSYKGHDEEVVIPVGVTHINRFCFTNNEHIKSIVLPMGLIAIDEAAFRGCRNLEYIFLPQTLKEIGSVVFMGCERLKEIHLPDSVERVDSAIFSGCNDVREIRISEKLWYIPTQMFYGCKKVESVRIPDYVSEIDAYAFGECVALKIAYVPKDTEVAENAFPGHTKIIRI